MIENAPMCRLKWKQRISQWLLIILLLAVCPHLFAAESFAQDRIATDTPLEHHHNSPDHASDSELEQCCHTAAEPFIASRELRIVTPSDSGHFDKQTPPFLATGPPATALFFYIPDFACRYPLSQTVGDGVSLHLRNCVFLN